MTTTPDSGIAGWVVDVVDVLGGPGVGLLVFLENVFPPIPSEVVLPLAGFAAGRGTFSLVEGIVWATIGSLLGALALYALGAWVGSERLAHLMDRVPLMSGDDVRKADSWFERRGAVAVLVARIVPGVRSLISVPAGVTHMRILLFTLLTFVGSSVWNSALILTGYALGSQWGIVEQYVGPVGTVVIAVLLSVVVYIVVRRAITARRTR